MTSSSKDNSSEHHADERVSSGVKRLDEALNGGFVKDSAILLIGKPGTAKTLFCASFIYDGAKKGEPGLYITTEERSEDIWNDVGGAFPNWDLKDVEKKKMMKVVSLAPSSKPSGSEAEAERFMKAYINEFLDTVTNNVKEINAKRLTIDSVSMVEMFIQNKYSSRVALMNIINTLKEYGVTTVFTSGIPMRPTQEEEDSMPEFLVDAVIHLDFVPVAERYNRTLTILKMRRSAHSTMIHPFLITDDGLELPEIKKPKSHEEEES